MIDLQGMDVAECSAGVFFRKNTEGFFSGVGIRGIYGKKYIYICIYIFILRYIEIFVLMILRFLFNIDIELTRMARTLTAESYVLMNLWCVNHFADLLNLFGHLFEIG